jgi:ATP-dependent RNA helicase SUPV3L1/SUV3
VDADGAVSVEGQYVGHLEGLRFVAERSALDNKALKAAVNQVLADALSRRARRIAQEPDAAFSLTDDGRIAWKDQVIARLEKGPHILKPAVHLVSGNQLIRRDAVALSERIERWLTENVRRLMRPLEGLEDGPFSPPARGVAFQLVENLGVLDRSRVADQLRQFDGKDYGRFKYRGVQLGRSTIFCPQLLKPEATRWRQILHGCVKGHKPPMDHAGLVSFAVERQADTGRLLRAGYRRFGETAVRVDMLERIAGLAHKACRAADAGEAEADHEMLSLLGGGVDRLAPVLNGLGYLTERDPEGASLKYRRRGKGAGQKARAARSRGKPPARKPRVDPDSPFAALLELRSS